MIGRKDIRSSMANMNLADSWNDESLLIEYLSKQLTLGRLAIVLGAGVSQFYGLPSWMDLINRLCDDLGETRINRGDDPILKAEALKTRHFKTDNEGFAAAVKKALYQNICVDFEVIRKNDLLSAIGALAMSSSRGSTSTLVTLNYDNLLEMFLEYHGYDTISIDSEKHWAPNHDVVVYHPHGFLPFVQSRATSQSPIVLGSSDYFNILSNSSKNLWRPLLQTLFRTHTFLYIGLSGVDLHLQSLVHDLQENHIVTEDRIRYHGVRFVESTSPNEDLVTQFENWGVYTHRLGSFSEHLPRFLFSICQAARSHRAKN